MKVVFEIMKKQANSEKIEIQIPPPMLTWFKDISTNQATRIAHKINAVACAVARSLGLDLTKDDGLCCVLESVPSHPNAAGFVRFHFQIISHGIRRNLAFGVGVTLLSDFLVVKNKILDFEKAVEEIVASVLESLKQALKVPTTIEFAA